MMATEPLQLTSLGEEQTYEYGVVLGGLLTAGALIGLHGDLGTGKTCFTRGLAVGLGISPYKVRSPSFTLVNEYSGGRVPLYHIDLYRCAPSDLDELALREYLYGEGACVVEWCERLDDLGAHMALELTFVGENQRCIVVSPFGPRYDTLTQKYRAALARNSEDVPGARS